MRDASFVIRHSSFVIRHSSFVIRHFAACRTTCSSRFGHALHRFLRRNSRAICMPCAGSRIARMKQLLTFVLLLGAFAGHAHAADSKLTETRSALEKWVETRQLIAKTRADWQADKETLEQTVALFERELKAVEEQFAKLNTNNSQVEKERLETEALLNASNEGLVPATKFAGEFEAELRKLVPRLPVPLQDLLKPLLARLPADSASTKMKPTERMQVLVGILNELDKFNTAVTIFTEKRKNASGAEMAVETVYVGLGAAYFVNDAGDFAGTGAPGADGWKWTPQPEIAKNVREVIRIYRNEAAARFVPLPATIR
jgi:cytochrome c556